MTTATSEREKITRRGPASGGINLDDFVQQIKNSDFFKEFMQARQQSAAGAEEKLRSALDEINNLINAQQEAPDFSVQEKTVPKNWITTVLLPMATAIAAYNRPELGKAMAQVAEQYDRNIEQQRQQKVLQWEAKRKQFADRAGLQQAKAGLVESFARLGAQVQDPAQLLPLLSAAVQLQQLQQQGEQHQREWSLRMKMHEDELRQARDLVGQRGGATDALRREFNDALQDYTTFQWQLHSQPALLSPEAQQAAGQRLSALEARMLGVLNLYPPLALEFKASGYYEVLPTRVRAMIDRVIGSMNPQPTPGPAPQSQPAPPSPVALVGSDGAPVRRGLNLDWFEAIYGSRNPVAFDPNNKTNVSLHR